MSHIVDVVALQVRYDLSNTASVVRALAYAEAHMEDFLFSHVVRSWLFATQIAIKEGITYDAEVLAVSTLLHDIGLTDTAGKAERFEVQGAIVAEAFVRDLGFDDRRAQLVWDSIALHTTPSISLFKEPEVSLCARGIGVDFGSPDYHLFKQEEIDAAVLAAPRLNLKCKFVACMCHLAQTRPETTYFNLARDFGERFIETYKAPSWVDIVEGGPYSE